MFPKPGLKIPLRTRGRHDEVEGNTRVAGHADPWMEAGLQSAMRDTCSFVCFSEHKVFFGGGCFLPPCQPGPLALLLLPICMGEVTRRPSEQGREEGEGVDA